MKIAFWSAFVVGFVLCSTIGIGPTLQRVSGSWTAPAMIAGSVIGALLLALAALFATGLRPTILPTDSAMLVALVALIAVKVAVGVVQAASAAAARG